MTEEIIIFEQDGNIVGITKEGKYFESYKTTENVAILRGAGLYIKHLEQENKELLETLTKGCYQNLQHECRIWELKESKYRSALEEIRKIVSDEIDKTDSNDELMQIYGTIYNKINEVLTL